MIFIFSAPSGSGKSTMVNHLLATFKDTFELSISATTRPPRGQEQHGREYYFMSVEEFKQLLKRDAFVEHEQVYEGLYYGTLKSEIERIEGNGHHVLFDIDVKGGVNVKRLYGDDATAIFICPPDLETLRKRLEGRGDTSPEMIEKRLAKAEEELSYKSQFDYIIINDRLERATAELDRIIESRLKG